MPCVSEPHRLFEVGRLEVQDVQVELSLHEPEECVPQRQRAFLRRADMDSRRLWFLWAEDPSPNCGCSGGCQFLDSSISREEVVAPIRPDIHHKPTNTAALLSLKRSLQAVSIQDLSCPHLLHHGLLACYERPSQPSPSQPPNGSDTESFISAKASLSSDSLSDTNEFYSLENVNEAGMEGHTLPDDLEGQREVQKGKAKRQRELDPLFSLFPSYKYHILALNISAEAPSVLQSKVALRIPVVGQYRAGKLPVLRGAGSGERERPSRNHHSRDAQSQLNVGVSILGDVSATLSPQATAIITRYIHLNTVPCAVSYLQPVFSSMAASLAHYFRRRAAPAVLTGCTLETSLSLQSYLSRILSSSSSSTEQQQPFSAQISLAVCPDCGFQLVQSHPLTHGGKLVCSFVTATICSLQVGSLLQTHNHADSENMSTLSSLGLSLQGRCTSLQGSLAVNLSSDKTSPNRSLPNLLTNPRRPQAALVDSSPEFCVLVEAGCNSPSFTVAAKIVTMEVSPRAVLTWDHIQSVDGSACRPSSNQTEEGRNQVALSLSLPQVWADVAAPHTGWPSETTGTVLCQTRSSSCRWMSAISGGLDPLLGYEVGVAWRKPLQELVGGVREVLAAKRDRDQRTLLALTANAARSFLKEKVYIRSND